MNKETITTQADITVRLFVAIAKALNEEYTRFIDELRHEQKKAYNDLLLKLSSFQLSIRKNMTDENIANCESLQEYMHTLICDLITNENQKDIDLFNAFCKVLGTIYNKYVKDYFKHNDKDRFIDLINSANLFRKSFKQNESINNDIERFCTTLIEGKEFSRR